MSPDDLDTEESPMKILDRATSDTADAAPADLELDALPAHSPQRATRSTLREEASSLLRFARRPTLDLPTTRSPRTTLHLFVMSMFMTTAIALPIVLLAHRVYSPPWSDVADDTGLVAGLLSAGLMAPILEEPTFRMWLARRRSLAVIGTILTLVWLLIAFSGGSGLVNVVAGAAVGVGFLALVIGLIAGRCDDQPFRQRDLPILVWTGAVVFGLAHLSNYGGGFDARYLWLAPAFVAPQILAGVVYSYTRVRQGLLIAILIHGLENSALTLISHAGLL